MKKVFRLFLIISFIFLVGVPVTTFAAEHTHEYENGICECNAYEEATYNQHINGGWEVRNAGQLMWVVNRLNSGELQKNVIIAADITLPDGLEWIPLGNTTYPFEKSVFGYTDDTYTINLNTQTVKSSNYGFIGYTKSTCKINDIIVEGTFNIAAAVENVGGVIGCASDLVTINNVTSKVNINVLENGYGTSAIGGIIGAHVGDAVIEKAANFGNINADGAYECVGGIVGISVGGIISECINYGDISSTTTKYLAGIIGKVDSVRATTISETTNIGLVSGKTFNIEVGSNIVEMTPADIIAYFNCSDTYNVSNNYYLNEYAFGLNTDTSLRADKITNADIESGRLASLLNSFLGQTIDDGAKEEMPLMGGKKVYQVYECDGTTIKYSNYNKNTDHLYTYRVSKNVIYQECEVCDHLATVELIIANDPYYDGTVQEATLVTDIEGLDISTIEISYDNEPIFPGTYTASFTYQNLTGILEYEVEKGIPLAEMFAFTEPSTELIYDGMPKYLDLVSTTEAGMGEIVVTYGTDKLLNPVDGGLYIINLSVLEGPYYQAYTFNNLDFVHFISIKPKEITVKWTNTTLYYEGEKYYTPEYGFEGLVDDIKPTATFSNQGTAVGSYTTTISISSQNYKLVGDNLTTEFVVKKSLVETPDVGFAVEEAGVTQKSNITDTEFYKVIENNGGINNGRYDVVLELIDPDNYTWKDTDEPTISIYFYIYQRGNEWIEYPTMNDWVYGEGSTRPQFTILNTYTDAYIKYRAVGGTFSNTIPTEVGEYEVLITFEKNDLRGAPLEDVILPFSILKANPKCNIDAIITRTYGTKLSDIQLIGIGDGKWNYLDDVDAILSAGEHQIEVEFTPNDHKSYNSIKQTITVIIEKVAPLYKEPTKIENLQYINNNQSLIIPGSAINGTMYYKVNEGNWTTNIPLAEKAGTYMVYYKVIGDENHYDTEEQSLTVVIEKAELTVTADNITIEQYTDIPKLTFSTSGLQKENVIIIDPKLSLPITDSHTSGEYTIEITGTQDDNYNITYVAGKLTITKHTECRGGVALCNVKPICEICLNEYGTPLEHSFTNYTYNEDATCTSFGTETAVCDNCEEKDTRDCVSGEYTEHSFTNYTYNEDATCTSFGTETAVCDNCEELQTRERTEGKLLEHSFTNYTSNNDATCSKDGSITSKCDHCEETDTIVIENSKVGHLDLDDNNRCDFCDEKINKSAGKIAIGILIGSVPVVLLAVALYFFVLRKKIIK